MMTAQDTYKAISSYAGVNVSTICDVRARCLQYTSCTNKSKSEILDFDGAAHTYQQEMKISTPQSVDAIAVDKTGLLLILIEKKTWENFLNHLKGDDKANPVDAAMVKIGDYDLKGKYESTRRICEHIMHDDNLFQSLPHVFVFLTEFSDSDPTAGFATMITTLAQTSSTVDYAIQQPIVQGMKSHLSSVHCRKSRYLNCMELDSFINDPSSFK